MPVEMGLVAEPQGGGHRCGRLTVPEPAFPQPQLQMPGIGYEPYSHM